MAGLVFIGLSRAGLEEAQRDRDHHAARLAERLYPQAWADGGPIRQLIIREVKAAMSCDREWPTCENP